MNNIPNDLLYTEEHEWVRLIDDVATVGITDHAQQSLGDVTFVDLPQPGDSFARGDTFGVVESVKAASDLLMPLSGEIIEINEDLEEAPELVNDDPYGRAWMIKIKVEEAEASQAASLLDSASYAEIL